MKTYQVHPLATIFPPITGAEFEAFADDIAANGLRNPIVMLDGVILDGRNRAHACHVRGVEPRFVEYDGDDPLAFILSENLHRRHLTDSQRAMVAARFAADNPGITSGGAAKMLKVSLSHVRTAREIINSAPPEVIAKVDSGELRVGEARRHARLRKEQRSAAPKPAAPVPVEPSQIRTTDNLPVVGLLSEINGWIASLAGRDVNVIPLDDRVAAAKAFAGALRVIQAARADRWKPPAERKPKPVSKPEKAATGGSGRWPLSPYSGSKAPLPGRPKPPPADGDVAAFLASGGEIKRMPTAAVGVGAGTICAEDSAALAAHEEGREAARAAKLFRNYRGSALADDGRVVGEAAG